MRQLSRDVPSIESRRRIGLVRNQVTEKLYRVTIGNATVSASTFDPSAIPRGEPVQVVWHPERNFWEIEQVAEGILRSGFLMQFWNANSSTDYIYVKTDDGGNTYDAPVATMRTGGTSFGCDIYYERWNGILQPNRVHGIVEFDAGTRGFYYNSWTLSSGAPVEQHTGTPVPHIAPAFISLNVVIGSIIVTPNGRIRIDGFQVVGTAQARYSDDGVGWTTITSNRPAEVTGDAMIGWHDRSTGIDDSVVWIYWDSSAKQLTIKRGTADGSAALVETAVATLSSITEPGGVAATAYRSSSMNSNGNGHISLVAWDSDVYADSKSLKSWDIYGATVTPKTDVVTSTINTKLCAISRLHDGLTLRVFYLRAGVIYYKDSVDEMDTWGAETLWVTPATGDAVVKIAVDPLPGVGAIGHEAPAWWIEDSGAADDFQVWQLDTTGTPIRSSSEVARGREVGYNPRGQVAWIAVP